MWGGSALGNLLTLPPPSLCPSLARSGEQRLQPHGAGREDPGRERGAGPAPARQPPGQHLWGPDHGLDGERGHHRSQVRGERTAPACPPFSPLPRDHLRLGEKPSLAPRLQKLGCCVVGNPENQRGVIFYELAIPSLTSRALLVAIACIGSAKALGPALRPPLGPALPALFLNLLLPADRAGCAPLPVLHVPSSCTYS